MVFLALCKKLADSVGQRNNFHAQPYRIVAARISTTDRMLKFFDGEIRNIEPSLTEPGR